MQCADRTVYVDFVFAVNFQEAGVPTSVKRPPRNLPRDPKFLDPAVMSTCCSVAKNNGERELVNFFVVEKSRILKRSRSSEQLLTGTWNKTGDSVVVVCVVT